MRSVYLETTIVSYLVARPSKDALLAAHQAVTRDWWERERGKYRCLVSAEVLREASLGDPEMAGLRLRALEGLGLATIEEETLLLAERFLATGALPVSMRSDALHLAVAVEARADYLLTWNCSHLANAHILKRIGREAARMGWALPLVCTPLELTGDDPDAIE